MPIRKRTYNNITEAIGNTPLVRLPQLGQELEAEVFGKLEAFNPSGSVKCRLGFALVQAGIEEGLLKPGGTIIEPTSGNTGIALAFVARALGYRVILTMPETMSIERRKLVTLLGAELVLTPGSEGMKGAIKKAEELAAEIEGSFLPMQFNNEAGPKIHYETTGPEIWEDTAGEVDVFVVGVGTGGTLTGAGRYLKEKNPNVKIVAVEPEASAVLSGNAAGPHPIQGIGPGFVPQILDTTLIDEIIQVKSEDAFATAQKLASKEGILAGISSGATTWAALEVAKRQENKGKKVVVILADSGERYLSTPLSNMDGG